MDRIDGVMKELRAAFQATSSKTIEAFVAIQRRLSDGPDVAETLEALRRELHRVRGTAGSYGFVDASRLAEALERRAVRWSADRDFERTERAAIVAKFIDGLGAAFGADRVTEPAGVSNSIVAVVDADAVLLEALAPEAALRGYTLVPIGSEACDTERLRALSPRLLLVRVPVPAGVADGARAAGVPVLGLESRPKADRGEGDTDPDLAIADITESVEPALLMAERLLQRSGWSGATVLAVDDDPTMLAFVRAIFSGPEFRVETLDDPGAVMQVLRERTPSLLLLDISMPGLSGIELVKQVRAEPRFHDLPVILTSGSDDAATREAALLAGADEFVAKPLAPAELRARIADRLERQRASRLAAGVHPATGLLLADRLAREGQAAMADLGDRKLPASVIMVRPTASELADDGGSEWLRETSRIERGLAGVCRACGYEDGLALVAVLATDAGDTMTRMQRLAETADPATPRWRAGVVAAEDLDVAGFRHARLAAAEAVDEARRVEGDVVRRWRAVDSLSAPDVILVEDDPSLTVMMEYALQATGITFRTFNNGVTALDHLLRFRTAGRRPIVLLDVDLPGMDGYSLHERLRAARPADYQVIFVTVHAAESDQVRALKLGAMDYIAKPVNLRILMAKMSTWLQVTRRAP